MLTIFLTILSVIGLFLNWPIINQNISGGLFTPFTTPLDLDPLVSGFREYSMGILRADGILLAFTALLMLLTAFAHTSRIIINLRIFLLAFVSALLSAEIFAVFKLDLPFFTYTGLLFSFIFLLLAFLGAVFRIGSMKSFRSTFIGKPMSDSRVFSRSLVDFIGNITGTPAVRVSAVDDLHPGFKKGESREFEGSETRIGRDIQWANLVVGPGWEAVSAHHGILRVVGESMFFEPQAGHYAFALDGVPYKETKEIKNNSELSLVSGYGPKLIIQRIVKHHSLAHPRAAARAGEIARDEFKRLQATFKFLLVMIFLALPLLWVFLQAQEKGWHEFLNEAKKKNEQLDNQLLELDKRIHKATAQTQEKQAEVNELKKQVAEKENKGQLQENEIEKATAKFSVLQEHADEKNLIQEMEPFAKVVDIKFTYQRIGIVFPLLTVSKNGKITVSTAFFAKAPGTAPGAGRFIAAEAARVLTGSSTKENVSYAIHYTRNWDNFAAFYRKIEAAGYSTTKLGSEWDTFLKFSNVLKITGDRWETLTLDSKNTGKSKKVNGIAVVRVEEFPDFLIDDIPVIDPEVSLFDRVIVSGFRGGRKFYSCGLVRLVNRDLVYTGHSSEEGLRKDGGLLLKVLVGGKYSLAGVLQTTTSNSQSKTQSVYYTF